MKKDRPHLVATEIRNKIPILIIDKKGIVGSFLANKLKEQFLVVYVSGRSLNYHDNVIHVPYRQQIPIVPDNAYSHIFVFYNGEDELIGMLSSFVRKANSVNGKVFFLTSLAESSEKLFRRLNNHTFYHVKKILYGEVFDGGTKIVNMVNYLIHNARTYGKVVLPNEGLGNLYPVWIEDLLAGIIAIAFSDEKAQRIVFAFPKIPFSEISVARLLQKIRQDLKIDFNRRKTISPKYYIPPEGEYIYKSYDLEEGLKKAMKHSAASLNGLDNNISYKQPVRYNTKLFLYGVLAALILPIIYVGILTICGLGFATAAIDKAENGNFKSGSQYASIARMSFGGALGAAESYLPLRAIAQGTQEKIVKKLNLAYDASDIEVNLLNSLNTFKEIYKGESTDSKNEFIQNLANTKNSLLKLEEMRAQKELPKNIDAKIDKISYLLSVFENTVDSYPELLGFNGDKKYLLFFQNNMEIRPGGGFIGSYATVDVKEGRIGKLEIHDIYDADGKLKTHVEPPFGLKRYGGVAHWFLRDTNFDIDTISNAAAAASILKLETGEHVDGVISIDTNFIKNILAAIGPVDVIDYKEKVSVDNFYLLTQSHVEDNFFPGSTQKKDFLRSLLQSILTKLSDKNDASYLAISSQVEKSIKEKHLYFVFENEAIEKTFSLNNLSGTILDVRRKVDNSVMDAFGVVDANIGANKSNYYLKRAIAQNVTVSDSGLVNLAATVSYNNTSTKSDKFGGDYKNYVRFILPSGADLKSVSIDGRDTGIIPAITNPTQYQSSIFTTPKEIEIESSQIDQKEIAGFYLVVPMGSTKNVTINYTIPQSINISSPAFEYALRIFKQPGTDADPYSLVLNYPNKFKTYALARDVIDLGGKVTYEAKLNEDKDIRIQFSQK